MKRKRHLNLSESASAMIFGVIVTITTICGLSLAGSKVAGITLIIAVTAISINISHSVLHGYLYVFEKGFERGKYWLYGFKIRDIDNEDLAIRKIEEDINGSSLQGFSPELKKKIALEVYAKAKTLQTPSQMHSRKTDYIGGFYKGILIFLAGCLVIWPFFIFSDLSVGSLVSFSTAIVSLGILGWFYGGYIFKNKLLIAMELIVIGLLIVIISLLFGG